MTTNGNVCSHVTKSGKPCRAYALSDSQYCFSHEPAKAAERTAARRAGGYARRRSVNIAVHEPVKLATVADVVKLLESEVNHILTLEISLSRAQTVARLALAFIKAFEVSEMQTRLAVLEAAVLSKKDG